MAAREVYLRTAESYVLAGLSWVWDAQERANPWALKTPTEIFDDIRAAAASEPSPFYQHADGYPYP